MVRLHPGAQKNRESALFIRDICVIALFPVYIQTALQGHIFFKKGVRCMALSREVHDKMKAGGALLVAIGFTIIVLGTFNEQVHVVSWLPHNYGAYIGFGVAALGGILLGFSKEWHHHETVDHIYVSSPDEELG